MENGVLIRKIEKKIPKDIKLPNQLIFKNSNHTHDLKKIINIKFKNHPGNLDDFWIGTTRKDAEKCLKNFIEKKLIFSVIMKMQ